jgi:hypothetical protein
MAKKKTEEAEPAKKEFRPYTVEVDTDGGLLLVRKSHSKSSAPVGRYRHGAKLRVVGENGEWLQVNNGHGWVMKKYTKPTELG